MSYCFGINCDRCGKFISRVVMPDMDGILRSMSHSPQLYVHYCDKCKKGIREKEELKNE